MLPYHHHRYYHTSTPLTPQLTGRLKLPEDITVTQFQEILNDSNFSSQYQFIDVREKAEVDVASIKKVEFVNLPTSQVATW